MKEILLKIIQDPLLHARWLNTLSYLEFLGARKIARSALPENQNEMRLRHLAEEARHAHFFKRMIFRLAKTNPEKSPPYFAASQSALRAIAKTYEPKNLFCGGAALRYFHGLDALVRDTLLDHLQSSRIPKNPAHSNASSAEKNLRNAAQPRLRPSKHLPRGEAELCYLYVTLLVEERAGLVYPLYDGLLQEAKIPVRLSGVLSEEERHLSDMKTALAKHPLHKESLLSFLRKKENGLFLHFQRRMAEGLSSLQAA